MSASETQIRLAACSVVRTRFAGRADMERAAARDRVCLAILERALGLATDADVLRAAREAATDCLLRGTYYRDAETIGYLLAGDDYAAREAMAARRYAASYAREVTQAIIAMIVAPLSCGAIDNKRRARASLAAVVDPIAARKPEHARHVITIRRAKEVIAAAGLRTATHGHAATYRYVPVGQESASASTSSVSPGSVGLPTAYARRAYSVTTSQHAWYVSAAILAPATRALNDRALRGVVYLSACVRVRSGRGTSLVTETMTARGAWR